MAQHRLGEMGVSKNSRFVIGILKRYASILGNLYVPLIRKGDNMISVVVDVDDTLIDTARRTQAVWHEILNRNIPLEAVHALNTRQIFERYASADQKARVREIQKRFWDIVLCIEKIGVDLLKFEEPVPFAAETLQAWSKQCMLVYLTGRPETTRSSSLQKLKEFGFPTEKVELVMYRLGDYARARGEPTGPTLVEARHGLFSSICKRHNVARVVDDYPGYFTIYKKFNIPERIGLRRSKLFSQQDYIKRGATKVVESWEQLRNDPPNEHTLLS